MKVTVFSRGGRTALRRKLSMLLFSALMMMVSVVPVFAEDGGNLEAVETALTTSFTSVGTSMTNVITKVLPIALPIMAAMLLITFGIKVFKRITNKA